VDLPDLITVRRAQRRTRDQERGSTALQTVIVWPIVLTLVFLGFQAGLWYLGRTAAFSAAQEGARAAAIEGGSVGAGVSAAESFLSTSTIGINTVQVTGSRTATTATITVRAQTTSLIPGVDPTVVQTAALPVERITG
jgi:Flp pilus assembly protein TadG